MIQVLCDNCGKALRDKPDQANANNPDWKPDVHGTLKLHLSQGNNSTYAIDMDLCLRCAKKYIRVLGDPV